MNLTPEQKEAFVKFAYDKTVPDNHVDPEWTSYINRDNLIDFLDMRTDFFKYQLGLKIKKTSLTTREKEQAIEYLKGYYFITWDKFVDALYKALNIKLAKTWDHLKKDEPNT